VRCIVRWLQLRSSQSACPRALRRQKSAITWPPKLKQIIVLHDVSLLDDADVRRQLGATMAGVLKVNNTRHAGCKRAVRYEAGMTEQGAFPMDLTALLSRLDRSA
jgi:hypothetical protein